MTKLTPYTDGPQPLIPLVGLDSRGEAFQLHGRVFRGIYSGHRDVYEKVLGICEDTEFFDHAIVSTWRAKRQLMLEARYDLLLEHEAVPFVAYPHEWPPSMLKDAALFHLALFGRLAEHDLIIKDWHPMNVLFKGAQPVFVDFTSIIPMEGLRDETYLTQSTTPIYFKRLWDSLSQYFFEMYERMYLPYFLLPLHLMALHKSEYARYRMFKTTLNASSSVITRREVFKDRNLALIRFRYEELSKQLALIERGRRKQRFWCLLRRELEGLDVGEKKSNYTAYYTNKHQNCSLEPSSAWTQKHFSVYEVLKQTRPNTVLDIACNVGWFSRLAASEGAKVVAADIDEACVESLYQNAKSEGLDILPLIIDFTRATPDVFPIPYENEPNRSELNIKAPILRSLEKRLQCELVLALAIIHHFALGQNLSFEYICKTLASYCEKWLLVEFVPRHDPLILSDQDFFPALKASPHGFEWYTQANFVNGLERYFSRVERMPSYPETRILLLCSK